MGMETNITVVVPIYNVEKYVAKCLNSLIKQNYTNFEVLCVDDGSPDNSKAIVKKYAEKDSRIKLIEKENGGYGSVLQYSINNIRTEYFLICDPDDWLESTALKNLYEFAESNNLDIAVGDMYGVYPEGNDYVKKYIHTFYDELRILPNRVYTDKNIIEKFSFGHVSPHAKLFRTEKVIPFVLYSMQAVLPTYKKFTIPLCRWNSVSKLLQHINLTDSPIGTNSF